MSSNLQTPANTAEAPMPTCAPSKEALRQKTQCPGCGKTLSYHALAYKHRCPKIWGFSDHTVRKERSIKALQARISAKFAAEPVPIPAK